ncbi:MAG: alpha/beta fold hydrolase, partial [Micrococcales bacterium]|nr:alpha/beta fold hydrolase [Micrococcales bacterium]
MTSQHSLDASRSFAVPRPGGELLVHDLSGPQAAEGSDAPLIVLVHGITANGLSWLTLARALASSPTTAGCRVWAPDLRGRAGSRGLPSPYGLASHVADLAALA